MANTNLPQDWAEVPGKRQAARASANTSSVDPHAPPVNDIPEIGGMLAESKFAVTLSEKDRMSMPCGAFIPFRDQNLLTFGVPTDEVGAKEFLAIAKDLRLASIAVNHLAMMRGENDNDPASTIAAATYGAVFLQHWAEAFVELAHSGFYGEAR